MTKLAKLKLNPTAGGNLPSKQPASPQANASFGLEKGTTMSNSTDGLRYVICRTYSAGVFAGYLEGRNGREVVLRNARRLWFWAGAASLSELAMSGTYKPKECKFPMAVDRVELLEAIEILDCTEKAKKSIEEVPVWSMKKN